MIKESLAFGVAASALFFGAGAGFLVGWIVGVAQEKTANEKRQQAMVKAFQLPSKEARQ